MPEPEITQEKAEKILTFLREYAELCKFHGVFIFSEGEALQAGLIEEGDEKDLWGVQSMVHGFWRPHSSISIEKDHGAAFDHEIGLEPV